MNKPAVLLLDEPLGALDLKLRKQMQVELKGIQREVGITFLYVTHDQEEALAMSDRIAVMEDGEVRQCGTPEEVYERPLGPFVAGFIGISNLLPGPDGTHISVRPEKIWLGELEEGMTVREGTVVERVYVGTTTQVIVELSPGVRLVALEQNTARQRSDDRWEIGQRVKLGWHAGARPRAPLSRRLSERWSFSTRWAALCPHAPITPPPGWVPAPHR